MFVVNGGRQTGKTAFLIWKSAFTGIPIMCQSSGHKDSVEHLAATMGVKIPKPLVWRGSRQNDMQIAKGVLIDEGQHWINRVLRETMNAELTGMVGDFRLGELRPYTYEIDKTDNVFEVGENKWNLYNAALYGNFVQKEDSPTKERKE